MKNEIAVHNEQEALMIRVDEDDHDMRFVRGRGWRLRFKPTKHVSYHYSPMSVMAMLKALREEQRLFRLGHVPVAARPAHRLARTVRAR